MRTGVRLPPPPFYTCLQQPAALHRLWETRLRALKASNFCPHIFSDHDPGPSHKALGPRGAIV